MNDYEFWNELGKIFNAVVAYQEKAVEFNKRFINPWIRLGNVFDKQDRNQEAICAYEKAIELDPASAQNWYELGNLHFREKDFDKAVEAYQKAIELGPESGWSYNNLALTLVSQGKYTEALALYQKGVDLIGEDKEKAIVWNRIGNVYRKLNQYDLAIQSFQRADELDSENAGFRDELDDAAESVTPSKSDAVQEQEPAVSPTSIQLILSDSPAEPEMPVETQNSQVDPGVTPQATAPKPPPSPDPVQIEEPAVAEPVLAENKPAEDLAETESAGQPDSPTPTEPPLPGEAVVQQLMDNEQTTSVALEPASETLTKIPETVVVTMTDTATEVIVTSGQVDEGSAAQPAEITSVDVPPPPEVEVEQEPTLNVVEITIEATEKESDADVVASRPEMESEPAEPSNPEASVEAEEAEAPEPSSVAEQLAYEVYLKDNDDLVVNNIEGQQDPMPEALKEPAAYVDPSGELQIEMDTKNAHVWNELGNIYFNTGAYDDAIVAYSKAIQLDRWFAWPYSNLALTYVQKGRFTEAILLYQRSIELFASEKDKAISWNRLGNVYRRLNNYDNAISAYQRADELDPENTTLSLQSRFSLLGNYSTDQAQTQVSQTEEVA